MMGKGEKKILITQRVGAAEDLEKRKLEKREKEKGGKENSGRK